MSLETAEFSVQSKESNQEKARLGLVLGFTRKEPGPEAALWIRVQKTTSCGTYVSFNYEKKKHRLVDGKLESKKVRAPEGVEIDRSAPPGD